MKIGDLVREEKGTRFGGTVVKLVATGKVLVQWSDGINKIYKMTSLEPIRSNLNIHLKYP